MRYSAGLHRHSTPLSRQFLALLNDLDSSGQTLVVTSFGLGGGRLIKVTPEGIDVVDRVSTKGIDSSGELVIRAVDSTGGVRSGSRWGEIATYDRHGLLRLERLDGVGDLHDVIFDGDTVLLVSTATDSIVRLRQGPGLVPQLEVVYESGTGVDSTHLNCIALDGAELVATSFTTARGWSWRTNLRNGVTNDGQLFAVETGKTLVEGLARPHSPQRWRDGWVIANAGDQSVAVAAADGSLSSIPCGGFCRALQVCADFAVAATSPPRVSQNMVTPQSETTETFQWSSLVLIDLVKGHVVEEFGLPFVEIYDVAVIDDDLVTGLRRGASASALRLLERAAIEQFWPEREDPTAVDPIAEADRIVSLATQVPDSVVAGSTFAVEVDMVNEGSATLASLGQNRVLIGWWWGEPSSPMRGGCGLISPVLAGESLTLTCQVDAPIDLGMHRLTIGVVQERVGWFEGAVVTVVNVEELAGNTEPNEK